MPIYQSVVFMMSMRKRANCKKFNTGNFSREEALLLILQGNIISVHAVNKLYKRKLFGFKIS